jgi:hypothetical protein
MRLVCSLLLLLNFFVGGSALGQTPPKPATKSITVYQDPG